MKNSQWAVLVGVLACAAVRADAPINLAASRPAPPVTQGTRVIIPPTVGPACGDSHGSLIAVCTTFPGKILLDGAGNVYKQPVEVDPQGRQRALDAPVPLAPPKQVGGVTVTEKP